MLFNNIINAKHCVALKSDGIDDGTVYAGQPAVHLVRRAPAVAVLWPVVVCPVVSTRRKSFYTSEALTDTKLTNSHHLAPYYYRR